MSDDALSNRMRALSDAEVESRAGQVFEYTDRALGLRVGLSSAIHLGWGLGLLIIFPVLAYPLAPTLLIVPDLGYLIVISSVVALVWGIARLPLTYVTLRGRTD